MLLRRDFLALSCAALAGCASPAARRVPAVNGSLATGSRGGGFLLYGEALAEALAATPLQLRPLETPGTAENIRRLAARQVDAALLVMGPAWEAWHGESSWQGKPERSMRALFPMYETPFHVAVAARSPSRALADLAGRKVGVGPARGTAEGFFRGLMESTGLRADLVNGSPSDHAKQLADGTIDAFWFGAGLPVPAFVEAARLAPIRVLGLTDAERRAFLARFRYFAPSTVPAHTYAGQATPVDSVAVWNFAAVHRDAPEDFAYWLTRLAIENAGAMARRYPAASATQLQHLGANTFLPFHAGALRYFSERGVTVRQPA